MRASYAAASGKLALPELPAYLYSSRPLVSTSIPTASQQIQRYSRTHAAAFPIPDGIWTRTAVMVRRYLQMMHAPTGLTRYEGSGNMPRGSLEVFGRGRSCLADGDEDGCGRKSKRQRGCIGARLLMASSTRFANVPGSLCSNLLNFWQ
nr:hypothetical protein CFP56_10140 [Quercus suber]